MQIIKRIAVFSPIIDGDWIFRCSISNGENIMVYAMNRVQPTELMIRYFTDPTLAEAWVQECKAGKHID